MNPFYALALADRIVSEALGGQSPDHPLYRQAEKVRCLADERFVFVTYEGIEYGPNQQSWDNVSYPYDKEKMLVYIQTDKGVHMKIWFYKKDVEKPTEHE